MRNQLRLPTLALVALLGRRRVRWGTASAAPGDRRRVPRHPPPSAAARRCRVAIAVGRGGADTRSLPPTAPRAPPTTRCRCGSDPAATRAWSTSWSATGTRPIADKPINLSYIPHTEMVDKIARGIATGDVPDLMGMDLIYAPQFENAGQLVDITDKISAGPSSPPPAPVT